MFIIQLGAIKAKELLDCSSADVLIHYMLKELEMAWRMKFSDCQEGVYKDGVDSLVLIVDLKGAKLKDLSNKQVTSLKIKLSVAQHDFQSTTDWILEILPWATEQLLCC